MTAPPQGDPPTFLWTGPQISGDVSQTIKLTVDGEFRPFTPVDWSEQVALPGALEAYVSWGTQSVGPAAGGTNMLVDARTAGGILEITAQFPAGDVGERMGRDLLASLDLTGLDSSAGTLPDGEQFVLVHFVDQRRDRLVIEPAAWLEPGRALPCMPYLGPDLSGHVEDCVVARSPRQTIAFVATQFAVVGPPAGVVDTAGFAAAVEAAFWTAVGEPRPLMGWATVEGGEVIGFRETPRQAD
jgi:hypothetical protein